MNDWSWWQSALENPREIGKSLKVSVDSPEVGFFKTRYKGKQWEPCALWQDEDGKWIALRNGKPVDAMALWNWVCRTPVSAEEYERALSGNGWSDDDPVVAAAIGIGHNVGSDIDALRDQIEAAKEGADAYYGIENDAQAGRAQSLRARMNELAGEADKKREELKKPHFEAGKKIDKEWMPLIKEAKAVADMLRQRITDYETLKLRERQRLEAERQRAEQERLAEEERARETARLALEAGRPVVVPPAPAPLPPLPPAPETTLKGNYGRAASIGVEKVIAEITDMDALFQWLRNDPDMTAYLLYLAQRAVKAGHEVPGVRIEERARVS
jgi:hypothetical protein